MEHFSELLDDLYFTNSKLAKETILTNYLRTAPDPDRGWTLAAITGTLSFDLFKRNLIKTLMMERMDPFLFDVSRDYVGEMSETVALAWPQSKNPIRLNRLPSLDEVIAPMPDMSNIVTFSPVMLAHPIDEGKDLERITPACRRL